MQPFAFGPQRLSAGGEDVNARCRRQDRFGQRRRAADDVLAAVEHDQGMLVAQPSRQAWYRVCVRNKDSQHGAKGARHKVGTGQRGKPDEPDSIPIGPTHGFGDCDRHRGFADPAGTDDRQKTASGQLRCQSGDNIVAADDPFERRRRLLVVFAPCRRGRCRVLSLARHRRNKAIAAARDSGNVSRSFSVVSEDLAQCCDMYPQSGLIHERIGPRASDQPILRDGLASTLNKRDENVKGPATEAERLPIFAQQHPLRRGNQDRSEAKGFFLH